MFMGHPVFDGAMVHVPLMFLSEWHELPSVPCLAGKKLDNNSRHKYHG